MTLSIRNVLWKRSEYTHWLEGHTRGGAPGLAADDRFILGNGQKWRLRLNIARMCNSAFLTARSVLHSLCGEGGTIDIYAGIPASADPGRNCHYADGTDFTDDTKFSDACMSWGFLEGITHATYGPVKGATSSALKPKDTQDTYLAGTMIRFYHPGGEEQTFELSADVTTVAAGWGTFIFQPPARVSFLGARYQVGAVKTSMRLTSGDQLGIDMGPLNTGFEIDLVEDL